MKLAITVCATKSYVYAMQAQARRVQANINNLKGSHMAEDKLELNVILVGDKESLTIIGKNYEQLIPDAKIHVLEMKIAEHKNYKENAQLAIAQMRTGAFSVARSLDADLCWSLDSDVLPPTNALDCMLWSLKFDMGYYSVATCPYPSQGGGGFLGGRGTPLKQIAEDWTEEEREVPFGLMTLRRAYNARLSELITQNAPECEEADYIRTQLTKIQDKIQSSPPKGNVFEINGKYGWKARGWLDNAYPAIGKGALLPSDWCGFGCTLMNRKALDHAHFEGYHGGGTEDLFIVWNRWHQMGYRINVITHCLCDHVIRNPGNPGHFVLCHTYHETQGEGVGHIRMKHVPWYSMEPGELFNDKNDGKLKEAKVDSKPKVNAS